MALGLRHPLETESPFRSSAGAGAAEKLPMTFIDPDFSITAAPDKDRVIVSIRGMLDETSVGEFRRAFVPVLNGRERVVVLDVSGVPLIDSDGFGALINLQKRLTESGKMLALAGCQEAVRLALALTRLEVLFASYPDVDSVPRKM